MYLVWKINKTEIKVNKKKLKKIIRLKNNLKNCSNLLKKNKVRNQIKNPKKKVLYPKSGWNL